MRLFQRAEPDPFPGVTKPSELMHRAGQWIADGLGDGFVWRKKGELVRARGACKETLHWTASKFNSAETGSSFDMFAALFDSDFARWQKANRDRVLQDSGFVANQASRHHRLTIHKADERHRALADCLQWHREVPLPWFSLLSDPTRVTTELAGSSGFVSPIVEWLLWQDRRDLVSEFVLLSRQAWAADHRFFDVDASIDHGRELKRSGYPGGGETASKGLVALGWVLEANDL